MNWLALLALAAAPAFAGATSTPRQPVGKWVVDYGETKCAAYRKYGSEGAETTLAFVPSPGGSVVRIVLARPGRTGDARHFRVKTNITPAEPRQTGLRFQANGRKSNIVWINFLRSDLDRLAETELLEIDGEAVDERLAVPGFGAVLRALDTCTADLRRHWNADAPEGSLQPAQSLKPLAAYVSDDDYPAQAIMEGASGITSFVLLVDEAGALKDCMVEETSGIATLDAMSCIALTNRAKFKPALNSEGQPVRAMLKSRIRWVITD